MKLYLIVGYAKNRVIGKDQQIPWKLPNDMKFFKETTIPHGVIMGRKTFESFPERFRPLPDRDNIIVTRDKTYKPFPTNERTHMVHSVKEAILKAEEIGCEKVFCAGGGEMYNQILSGDVLSLEDVEIIASEIDAEIEGDTFFPVLDNHWIGKPEQSFEKDAKNLYNFQVVRYRYAA